jgi:hypothetical protein
MTNDPDDDPFDMEGVRRLDDYGLHGFIGWMEFYRPGFPMIRLDRRVAIH